MRKQIKTKERLARLFAQKPCWTIDELCHVLGYAAISVRRFLKQLGYFSSFTHNSKQYALSSTPSFNKDGLWFCDGVGFSKHGNMKQTILYFVDASPQGLSAKELEEKLSIPCHAVLSHLYKGGTIDRDKGEKGFVYLSADARKKRRQSACLRSRIDRKREPESLSAQAAIYVLTEHIKNPRATFEELSRAVAKKQAIAAPEAIARLFEEHDLKKTPD